MTKWQKKLIQKYEALTGFEFSDKEEIKDNESFWDIWDQNLGWFKNIYADLRSIASDYEYKYRED